MVPCNLRKIRLQNLSVQTYWSRDRMLCSRIIQSIVTTCQERGVYINAIATVWACRNLNFALYAYIYIYTHTKTPQMFNSCENITFEWDKSTQNYICAPQQLSKTILMITIVIPNELPCFHQSFSHNAISCYSCFCHHSISQPVGFYL